MNTDNRFWTGRTHSLRRLLWNVHGLRGREKRFLSSTWLHDSTLPRGLGAGNNGTEGRAVCASYSSCKRGREDTPSRRRFSRVFLCNLVAPSDNRPFKTSRAKICF